MRKNSIGELARFGGDRSFLNPLHVNKPVVASLESFKSYTDGIWERGGFTNNGPLSEDLEHRLAAFLQVDHCVLMSSGTSALTLLLSALGVRGEILMPAYTFVSTAHAIRLSGCRPVFCDVDRNTWNLDVEAAQKAVSETTSAIIPTHLWGRPCDVNLMEEFAEMHGLHLIFDAAHAFGCSREGVRIGSFGDAEVFSFQANKIFHCGEGGAIACRDAELAIRLRAMRNFGFTGYDRVDYVGTNAKMSELSAALGLINLGSFEDSRSRSKEVFQTYKGRLEQRGDIDLVTYDEGQENNYQYVVVTLGADLQMSRDAVVDVLHAENILARRYFYPGCHLMEPYASERRSSDANLPVTRELAERVIVLPGSAAMNVEQADGVCDLLEFVLDNANGINARLTAERQTDSAPFEGEVA